MKAKLPLGKRPRGDEEESEEIEEKSNSSQQADATDAHDISKVNEDEPKSIVDKIKVLFKKLNKGKAELDEVAEGDEAAAKKKKSKMIQIAVGAGLVLFLLSDYIIPTEEPAAPEIKLKPRSKKVKPANTALPPPTDPSMTPPVDTAVVPPTDPSMTPPGDTTGASQTDITPIDPTVTETTSDSPVEVTSTDIPAESVIEPPTTDATTVDTPADNGAVDTPALSVDTIDGDEAVTNGDDNITDQILQDLENQAKDSTTTEEKKEYVSPPDYEYRGRGLVYNCSGKHWACVDGPSYKTCENNASSTKYLKKTTECYPFNIYETQKGCETMQNRMVTAAAKTSFCQDY